MKTAAASVALLTVLGLASPALAQNLATGPSATRDLGRLTLLPGPTLLSPARGAPQSTPVITIVPASAVQVPQREAFRYLPPTPAEKMPGATTFTPDASPAATQPATDTLRFDSQLPAQPTRLKDAKPTPKSR